MSEFYGNSMTYNLNGQFQLSDDYEESPECDDLCKCQTCGIYIFQNYGSYLLPDYWECTECTIKIGKE